MIGIGTLDMRKRFDITTFDGNYVIIEPTTSQHYSGMFGHRYFIDEKPDLNILEKELKNSISYLQNEFDFTVKYYYKIYQKPINTLFKSFKDADLYRLAYLEGEEDITKNITFNKVINEIPPTHQPFVIFYVKITFKN